MWVVRNKRQTLKQQLSFPFSQAQLDLLPDSSLPPLLSLQVILSQSPFREEASGAKGVLRGCDQDVVVSLFLSFLLHVHHPQAVENICSAMEHALLWPWGSLLILTLSNSPSISAGPFSPLFLNMFFQKCNHLSMDTWPLFKKVTPAASILPNLAINSQYQRCSISSLPE